MGDLLKQIKLDRWYGVTLYLGVLSCIAPFFKGVEFLNAKHIFGLGIGLILISLSNFIANMHMHQPMPGGFLHWEQVIHTPLTKIMLSIGFIITMLFLFLLVKGLI